MPFGVVFDIDGVLIRGGEAIAGAGSAVAAIAGAAGSTHVFVTNGGGVPEALKADVLARVLGADVAPHAGPERMLLSSTPMRGLVDTHRSSRILAVGRGPPDLVASVLAAYGFDNIVTMDEYIAAAPHLVPQWVSNPSLMAASGAPPAAPDPDPATPPPAPADPLPIDAVFVIHEPAEWGPALQVLVDVVLSAGGNVATRRGPGEPQVPVFVANPDFAYSDTWAHPRLTSGAFMTCLAALVASASRGTIELESTVFGKPGLLTYEYAERMLADLGGGAVPSRIYAIGDNPHSDIAGANAAGDHWTSILVRTGNFSSDADNSPDHPADLVFPSVVEAVAHILAAELPPPSASP